MKEHGNFQSTDHKRSRGCCCHPRRDVTGEDIRAREAYEQRRVAWRRWQRSSQMADPRLSQWLIHALAQRVSGAELLNRGVDVVPINFPAGTRPEDLANYHEIVRAFSRTFGPNLFEELSLSDPFPSGGPYWSTFFFSISPNTLPPLMRLNVKNSNGKTYCIGYNGQYQTGGVMSIFDCTPEEDIFHEIGHAVMEDGIKKMRKPLYFHYFPGGGTPVGAQPQVIDAIDILNGLFGRQLDSGLDTDGVAMGFVSKYASDSKAEDFAETFKFYVYKSSQLWEKIDRQRANGSETLSKKASLIADLYAGMYFEDGGIPAGRPGYKL